MGAAQNYIGVSRRPPDIEDYIDMARRYRSWIVAPMFVGLVASVVLGFLQPDTFVSYAVMRITPQQVPEKLIPSVMNTSQLAERVSQLTTEILSRQTLVDIIKKPSLDLYKKEQNKYPMEDVVQMMKTRDIRITPLNGERDGRFASAFQISFRYTDKYKATAVVRELVSRFESMNVSVLRLGVLQQRPGRRLRIRPAGAYRDQSRFGFDDVSHAGDDQRGFAVGDGEHRLQAPQHPVGAPILGELDRGAQQISLVFVELRLEALEQRERIRRPPGEARENLVVVQAPDLACARLHNDVAQRYLAVAAQRNFAVAARGQDRRSVELFHASAQDGVGVPPIKARGTRRTSI